MLVYVVVGFQKVELSSMLRDIVEQVNVSQRSEIAVNSLLHHKDVLLEARLKDMPVEEAKACVKILVPLAIGTVGSQDEKLAKMSVGLIQTCFAWEDAGSFMVTQTLQHLTKLGIDSQADNTSNAVMKLLPDLYDSSLPVSRT